MMADVEFPRQAGAYGRGVAGVLPEDATVVSLTTWTNIAGAVVSLALIAGVGVWGYKLMVRDVSGIPIVRATATEMRVRPQDPGGQLAEHQGLAVNEIAAQGTASGPVDQVVLAPPAVALAQEDQPVVRLSEPVLQPAPLAPASAAFETVTTVRADVAPVPSAVRQSPSADIDQIVAEVMAEAASAELPAGTKVVQARQRPIDGTLSDLQPAILLEEVTTAPDEQLEPAAATDTDTGAGIRASMRPRLRPSTDPALLRQASFSADEPVREIDAAAIPAGTRLAQLGAFESPEVARSEWSRMEKRFGDMLEGKSRVIQEAQSGGRTFYRLRAMGFVDLSDTRRFCSAIRAEGVDCIPVQAK